jgi:hypothetical protein
MAFAKWCDVCDDRCREDWAVYVCVDMFHLKASQKATS